MAVSTETTTQPTSSWGPSRPSRESEAPIRRRDLLAPIAATLVIAVANLAYGSTQPGAALPLSAAAILVAIVALAFAGPRAASVGMIAGAAFLLVVGLSGLAGPLHRAAPQLATLFAAGAMWVVGYIAGCRRRSLDTLWNALIWTSVAWCAWIFFAFVSTTRGGGALTIHDAFETPANGALIFGLLAIIGLSRILQLIKLADAEALAAPQVMDSLLREGFGGFLLLIASITCMILLGSVPGLIFIGAVLLGYAWWDTLAITRRPQYGLTVRLVVIATPFAALALACWGVAHGWVTDETAPPGLGSSELPPNIQRMEAFMASWLESPIVGHGLGSLPSEAARLQTLHNAKAMLAPGGAHNVFVTWAVETGAVGLALLLLALFATHRRILKALGSRRISRTFPRLAIAASVLLLLHGVTDSSIGAPAISWLYALLIGAACGFATTARREVRRVG